MADDGMLVNFSIADDILNTKPVFRGGRWKDRLSAKKSAERRHRASHTQKKEIAAANDEPAAPTSPDITATTERPSKRQKPNNKPSISHPNPRPSTANSKEGVISSLFSYNPSSTTSRPSAPTLQDEENQAPSNAPLSSSLSNFTSLGLSPTLAAHLLTKLTLKAPTAIQRSAITQLLAENSDAFIQAETGSGKTLAYLLPILQRIMSLRGGGGGGLEENGRKINRDSGLFAIILAPTRELCKQISIVLENLLRCCANWIVAGTVIGGEKKKSEKARLRKGLNILVATPGRLVDHLQHTEVLDVGRVRWLVLDEGDRLMELGFEEDVKRIVGELEKKSAVYEGKLSSENKVQGLPESRTTILCSATMKMTVQRLGEISLKDAVHITAEPIEGEDIKKSEEVDKRGKESAFLAPAQLKQSYIIAPPKQRLVTLAALLKHTFARKGSVMKAIVFLSCADSVDFHFELFVRRMTTTNNEANEKPNNKSHTDSDKENVDTTAPTVKSSPLSTATRSETLASTPNPLLTVYKLHGSLTQQIRTATLQAFTRSTNPSILICTDVASRGLDLPNIDLIIEYDPPFSSDDHLHRIGRTARAGNEGRAVIFLMPGSEEGYVDILRQGYRDGIGRGLVRTEAEDVLKKGFGNAEAALAVDQTSVQAGGGWSERAEQWQLDAERWVIDDKTKAKEMARRAFVSHVRAYATHVAKERAMFDVKSLHLGHLAKAFALRERPGQFGRGEKAATKKSDTKGHKERRGHDAARTRSYSGADKREGPIPDGRDAARKMQLKMKEHLAAASEFNIG
ncbi:MAG: hypothetical protein Q9220_002856 [cf. Caloplaca sp. 1 TL-2023]